MGRLDLRVPCRNCPFADRPERIVFACSERAEEISEHAYRSGFPCHLSAQLEEYGDGEDGYVFGPNTQHCAGAIGMFLNSGYYEWPALGNQEPPGDWRKAQAAAFTSEEQFISANAADAGARRHGK